MPTSDKKIRSNRINGQKSHGPIDTSSSRFNARKHSLLAEGITELDDADGYQTILNDLIREKDPVGSLETFLVKAAALQMVRWTRSIRLEAEFIASVLNPPRHEKDPLGDFNREIHGALLDPGIPAPIGAVNVQQLVSTFQRYETSFANRLFRLLHELERIQRMRQGERLPAPAAVDFSVCAGTAASTPVAQEQSKVSPSDGKSLPAPASGETNGRDDDATLDSIPVAVEQPKGPSSDGESLPAPLTVDVNGSADQAASESEHFAEVVVAEVVEVETTVTTTQVEWEPRKPCGPIWNKR